MTTTSAPRAARLRAPAVRAVLARAVFMAALAALSASPLSSARAADDDETEESGDDLGEDAATLIRKAWIGEQDAFAMRLAEMGWTDLADQVLAQTRQGDPRVSQPAPTGDELTNLEKTGIRLRAQTAERQANLAERRRLGDEAVKAMQTIEASLRKQMLQRYTELNQTIESLRKANKGRVPRTKDAQDQIARLNGLAVAARDYYEESQRDLILIQLDLGRSFARDALRAEKDADRRLARDGAYAMYDPCLAGGEEALAIEASSLYADRAYSAYSRIGAARSPEARQRATNQLEAMILARARFSHRLEEAFAIHATLASRNRDPEFDKQEMVDVRARVTKAQAELKNVNDARTKAQGHEQDRLTQEARRIGRDIQRLQKVLRSNGNDRLVDLQETGQAFFEASPDVYAMIPEDRQVYWHWMKFLAAFDDQMFIEVDATGYPTNGSFAALGKQKYQCERCHKHANQVVTAVFKGSYLQKEFENQKREFLRAGKKRKIVKEDKVAGKERNQETNLDEDVWNVTWEYESECTACHLHRMRYDMDLLDDPDKFPPEGQDRPLLFYHWNSDRVKYLFDRYFAWSRVAVLDENGRRRVETPRIDPHTRARGLYGYADALTSLAQGAVERYEKENDPLRKADWQRQSADLVALADNAVGQMISDRPSAFQGEVEIDASLRSLARLNLVVPWYVSRARAAKLANRPVDEQEEHLRRALAQCTLAQVEGGRMFKRMSQDAIADVLVQARRLTGRDLPQTSDTAFAKAEEAYGAYSKTRRDTPERRAAALEARRRLLDALAAAQSVPFGAVRVAQVPPILFRLADVSMARADFATAYVALFQLLQEFNHNHYPPERFSVVEEQTARYLISGAVRLPIVARRLAQQLGAVELEIEGLRMSLEGDPQPPPDRMAAYASTLKRFNRENEALDVIARVPKTSTYYGLMQVYAADIQKSRTLAALHRAADGSQPDDVRKAAEAEAKTAFADMETAVDAFLRTINLEQRPPRPDDTDPNGQRIYDLYTVQIPTALLLPIQCLSEAKRYPEVIRRADRLLDTLEKLPDLDPAARRRALADGAYYRYRAFYDGADLAAGSTADAEKRLQAISAAMDRLEAVDEAGQYSDTAFQQVGQAWLALAGRFRADGDTAREAAANLRGAEAINKATRLAYQNLGAALRTAMIFADTKDYARAVQIFTNTVDFWNNGLFTADYLLQDGKEVAQVSGAQPDPALAGFLAPLSEAAKWPGVAGVSPEAAAVAERLNEFIRAPDWTALEKPAAAFVQAARPLYADRDAALARKLDAADEALKRGDLAQNAATRNRLMRTLLEAAYPDWWTRAPLVASIPSPGEFDKSLEGFIQQYPVHPNAQKKASYLLAMHDAKAPRGDAKDDRTPAGMVAAKIKELTALLDPKAGAEPAARDQARKVLALFDPSLKVYLYGVEVRGRVQRRSYPRALGEIAGIRDFHKAGMPLPEGQDVAKLPTDAFLGRIQQALQFEFDLLRAGRQYAAALVTVGGRENEKRALALFEELVDYYPDDAQLLLALSGAHAQVAHNLATTEGGYGNAAGEQYIRARHRGQQVRDRATTQSELWWTANNQLLTQALDEITVRKAQNKTAGGFNLGIDIVMPSGKPATMKYDTQELTAQAQRLFQDIGRLKQINNPDLDTFNEAMQQRLDEIEAALAEMGFKPKVFEKLDIEL